MVDKLLDDDTLIPYTSETGLTTDEIFAIAIGAAVVVDGTLVVKDDLTGKQKEAIERAGLVKN